MQPRTAEMLYIVHDYLEHVQGTVDRWAELQKVSAHYQLSDALHDTIAHPYLNPLTQPAIQYHYPGDLERAAFRLSVARRIMHHLADTERMTTE